MTMKTTFDLPESLVREVKRIAKVRGTTARDIVQQALTKAVEESDQQEPFVLKDLSVSGWGRAESELSEHSLHELILMSYEHRE